MICEEANTSIQFSCLLSFITCVQTKDGAQLRFHFSRTYL